MSKVELIRGLVRPIATWIFVLALVVIVGWLVWNFADAEMAKTVIYGFMTLVTAVVSFWFGSRKSGGEG